MQPQPQDKKRKPDDEEIPPTRMFKDSVNPDDYHYLSTDQWDEQSMSAQKLVDVIRLVGLLKELP